MLNNRLKPGPGDSSRIRALRAGSSSAWIFSASGRPATSVYDGRVLNGFIADRDDNVVVLKGVEGESTTVAQDDIEEMRAIPRSVMPEAVLNNLDEQQIRDLFAYLRASQPLP